MTKHHLLVTMLSLGACGTGVPDQPTYFADVAPILRANCVRCHGADPVDPKIAKFRLDRYVKYDEDLASFDVWDYANGDPPPILRVAVHGETPVMPPDYPLSDRQRDIIERWIANEAPKGTHDNHAPEIQLVGEPPATTSDQSIDVAFRATDADLDGLRVQLWYHDLTDANAIDRPLGLLVGGGDRAMTLDTGTLASRHTFELYAVLDDGYHDEPAKNRTIVSLIPELLVDHGARGTAPMVQLLTPNGGETLIGTTTITWTADDPDTGDSLTYDLDLMRVDANGVPTNVEASIAAGLTNLSSLSYTWTIPPSIPAMTPFKIRVTATDTLGVPRNVRFDDSDLPVFVAQAVETMYTWTDVRPIFDRYCSACHDGSAKTPALDYFCLLKYNAGTQDPSCETSDDGVFEMKGLVYQRMVLDRSMPPAAEPQPTPAELDIVGNWLLGGAPLGAGPSNTPPTLTWIAPGASVLVGSGTPLSAPLMWSIADAEGLASDALEYTQIAGTGANTNCDARACPTGIGSPSPIVGAGGTTSGTAQTRMFDWVAPTQARGCFCVSATVTDAAGQSVTVTANKSVKF